MPPMPWMYFSGPGESHRRVFTESTRCLNQRPKEVPPFHLPEDPQMEALKRDPS